MTTNSAASEIEVQTGWAIGGHTPERQGASTPEFPERPKPTPTLRYQREEKLLLARNLMRRRMLAIAKRVGPLTVLEWLSVFNALNEHVLKLGLEHELKAEEAEQAKSESEPSAS